MATLGNTTALSLNVLNNINTSGTINGNGSGLTNLNASNISSGTLSADRLDNSGVTATSYGPSANAAPGYGGNFKVPYITVDSKGRITKASTQTITIPASDNTWRPLGTGAKDAAAGDHSHDGRYLKWNGSAADASAMTWGTLTSANEYTILSHASSSDGGDWGMTCKGGKIYMQLDGYYYQNEGQYRVLDTSDSSSFATADHTHSSVTDIGNSTATTFAYSKSGLNYGDYTWLAGWNGYELRAVNKSQFATAGHTHSNYVTTDTTQTISGAKTFSNTITANNWLYVPYIGTKTNKLYIEGPWNGAGQEQPTLTFEDGALKAYNWEDDGESVYESMFDFRFPYGVQMSASGASIYLNGSNGCTLTSTSIGWKLAQNDNLGSIYADGNNYGRIGNKDHHFYQGFINNIYANQIYPTSGGAGSTGNYNVGCVGDSGTYFKTGAFKTVYRTSESSLSDIRSKQNISNNDLNALEIINNLSIINFQYDDDVKAEARNKKQRLKAINTMKELPKTKENKELRKELQKIIATPNNEDMITIGVSAQQLQELLPKKYQKTFIQKESTNQYADQLFIKENRLVYLSFKAIQEQQTIIGSLEEKINLLEEKINALEEKMKKEVN